MGFTLVLSLEHHALAKIAAELWSQNDIKDLVSNFYMSTSLHKNLENWKGLEEKVITKVLHLLLPQSLTDKLLGAIKPVGMQILRWIESHRKLYAIGFVGEFVNKICWTTQGTIDKRKTAEVIVNDKSLDINWRYRLACIYCLEDDIHTLWKQLKCFSSCGKDLKIEGREPVLVKFWTYYLQGEMERLINIIKKKYSNDTPYEYAFRYSAFRGNEAAARYFYQKLTSEERKKNLRNYTEYVSHKCCMAPFQRTDFAAVLCFLLSSISKDECIELFKECPYFVLNCFLDWPWQSFFVETSQYVWLFLSEDYYNHLLWNIINKVITGYTDFDYAKIFQTVWKQSPTACKKYLIDKFATRRSLLAELFDIEEENIKLILKNATVERERGNYFGCCCDWDVME